MQQPTPRSMPSMGIEPPIQLTEDQSHPIPEFDYLQMLSANSTSVMNSESMKYPTIDFKTKDGARSGEHIMTQNQNGPSPNSTTPLLLEELHSLRTSLENANLENHRLMQELEETRKKDTSHFHQQAEMESRDSAVQTSSGIEEIASMGSLESPMKSQLSQEGKELTTEERLRRRLAILEEDFYNLLSSHQQLTEQLDSERALNDHMSQELQTIPDYVSAYRQEREELAEKYKEQQKILEGVYASLDKANSDYDRLRHLLYESSRRKSGSLAIAPSQDPSSTTYAPSADIDKPLKERQLPDWWSISSRQLRRDYFKCTHCSGFLRTL